jgi:hypothetical protein
MLNGSPKYRSGGKREVRRQESAVRMGTGKSEAKKQSIVLSGTQKCRSRTVVRLVMLAAWAKQSMLNDYLPQLRDRSAVVQNGRVTLRRNRDRIRLPQRTTLQKIEMRYAQRLSKVSGWCPKCVENVTGEW